jgi:hypothetical protein
VATALEGIGTEPARGPDSRIVGNMAQ